MGWIYRHRYLGQVFANTVLHDTPQVEGIIWFVRNTSAPWSPQLHVVCARGVLRKEQQYKRIRLKDLMVQHILTQTNKKVWITSDNVLSTETTKEKATFLYYVEHLHSHCESSHWELLRSLYSDYCLSA